MSNISYDQAVHNEDNDEESDKHGIGMSLRTVVFYLFIAINIVVQSSSLALLLRTTTKGKVEDTTAKMKLSSTMRLMSAY